MKRLLHCSATEVGSHL